MYHCINCGGNLRWNSDFTNEEIYGEEEPEGVTAIYSCDICHIDYDITTYEDFDSIKIMVYSEEE